MLILANNDPLRGYLDRVLLTGNETVISTIKGSIYLISISRTSLQDVLQHLIDRGYGTKETIKALFPEYEDKEEKE